MITLSSSHDQIDHPVTLRQAVQTQSSEPVPCICLGAMFCGEWLTLQKFISCVLRKMAPMAMSYALMPRYDLQNVKKQLYTAPI